MSLQEIMTLIKARMVKMHKWDCVCVGCEDLRKAYTRMLEAVAEPLVARDARIRELEAQLSAAQADAKRFQWCQGQPMKAQALFWNFKSRIERRIAIDAAIKASP